MMQRPIPTYILPFNDRLAIAAACPAAVASLPPVLPLPSNAVLLICSMYYYIKKIICEHPVVSNNFVNPVVLNKQIFSNGLFLCLCSKVTV